MSELQLWSIVRVGLNVTDRLLACVEEVSAAEYCV